MDRYSHFNLFLPVVSVFEFRRLLAEVPEAGAADLLDLLPPGKRESGDHVPAGLRAQVRRPVVSAGLRRPRRLAALAVETIHHQVKLVQLLDFAPFCVIENPSKEEQGFPIGVLDRKE